MLQPVENDDNPSSARRYKVIFIIDGLGMGGAERLMVPILEHLSKEDFDARVCVLQNKDGNLLADEIRGIGVPVDFLPIKRLRDLTAVPRILDYLNNVQADLIHTQLEFSNILGNIASKLHHIPSVCTIHTIPSNETNIKTRLHERLDRYALRFFCDHIVAVSDEALRYHLEMSGGSSKKISTIHNGIDLTHFININKDRDRVSVRQELGVPSKAVLLTTVAVLRPQKGIQFMIQGLPAILKSDPNVYYLVVGTGTYLETLKGEVERVGVKERVIFSGMRKDVPRLLSASDIFVLPTLTEALPTVLAEAMASRLPIVASSVGGIPEMVVNGENGILIRPEKPALLADACINLLSSGEARRTMGEKGWQVVNQKFNIRQQVEELKKVYLTQIKAYGK